MSASGLTVELKKEKLKSNQNAGDVLARGTGDRDDITRCFVALARCRRL